jgi:hydrogenase maturation protease
LSILVAGIGHALHGDDGFGVEVTRRLRNEPALTNVEVEDFGARGADLVSDLAGGRYEAAILVDVLPRGGAPGTLYSIEPDEDDLPLDGTDAHSLAPASVVAWMRRTRGRCDRLVIIGCEPDPIEESMSLSAPVAASVDRAVEMIHGLVAAMTRSRFPLR